LNRVASQVIIDDTYIRADEDRESTHFRETRNDQSISQFRAAPSLREFSGDREPNWQPARISALRAFARKRAKERAS